MGGGLPEKGKKILEQRGMRFALSYCMRVQTKVYLYQQALSHLSRKWPRGDIVILESLVGEGRLRAVRFFGNLAADGTLFLSFTSLDQKNNLNNFFNSKKLILMRKNAVPIVNLSQGKSVRP